MSFDVDLEVFGKHVEANYGKIVRGLVFMIGSKIMLVSPVGNPDLWKSHYHPPGYVGGRFKNNWMLGIDAIDYSTTPIPDPTGARFSAQIIIPEEMASEPHIYYMTNSLPYAERLDEGWSTQAIGGIIGPVELEFQNYVQMLASSLP